MAPKMETFLYSMLGLLIFLVLVGRKLLLVFMWKTLVRPQLIDRMLKED